MRGSKITHINDKGSRYYHSLNQYIFSYIMDKNNIILKLLGSCHVFSPGLVPRQLGDETAVFCMYRDQVPVNLQTARKYTGITQIYMLHLNPEPPAIC